MDLFIRPDGSIETIYSDDLQLALAETGTHNVKRASHVEPADGGGWTADMSPIRGGPVLGPFPTRADALAAEVDWLAAALEAGPLNWK
ncbi:MAG: hypothetical protein Q8S13_03745 [Dehalococcoidia bacterium]|nr:hypothetical protein [Dehalococcoidia bacterium]